MTEVENSTTNYVDVNENLKPYKIFQHQHQPEIQLYLAQQGYPEEQLGDIIFTPHLLPVNRGILSTIYLRFSEPIEEAELRKGYQDFWANKAVVHLLEPGVAKTLLFCSQHVWSQVWQRPCFVYSGVGARCGDYPQSTN